MQSRLRPSSKSFWRLGAALHSAKGKGKDPTIEWQVPRNAMCTYDQVTDKRVSRNQLQTAGGTRTRTRTRRNRLRLTQDIWATKSYEITSQPPIRQRLSETSETDALCLYCHINRNFRAIHHSLNETDYYKLSQLLQRRQVAEEEEISTISILSLMHILNQ